jgi:hypothetical protein
MMSEHNKRLVRRALEEIYAKGELELADELVHPDFVDHEPAHPEQPTGPRVSSRRRRASRAPSAAFGSRSRTRSPRATRSFSWWS